MRIRQWNTLTYVQKHQPAISKNKKNHEIRVTFWHCLLQNSRRRTLETDQNLEARQENERTFQIYLSLLPYRDVH